MIRTLEAPVLYSIELTPRCNNHCPGCYNVFSADRENGIVELSLVAWRTILEHIQPHAHLIKLTGGEPTMYPDLPRLIALLDDLEIRYTLFTHGRWQAPAQLIGRLRASRSFRGLLISLHGASEEAHEAFTQTPHSFAETCQNIRRATQDGLHVVLSTVIHKENLHNLEHMPSLCTSLGADHISFNRHLGPPVPFLTPTPQELRSAVKTIERMRQLGARVRFGNCIPQCFVPSSSTGCLAGVAYCTIDPWGNVRPCNHEALQCGNLLEESIKHIWMGTQMNEWRSSVLPACQNCAAYPRCHAGCRAQGRLTGALADPLMADPITELPLPSDVQMGRHWRPRFDGEIRKEAFGYVLLQDNRIAAVNDSGLPIIRVCDGRHTLQDLEERFGSSGLRLVYGLYQKGLVDMQT